MDPYLRLVANLPRPTREQTDRFVEFVAGAHSWYKHLPPFPPGAAFTFYLDPDSGRDLIHTPGGEKAFADRVDDRDRFHYTWMKTAEYRERFGYWQYHSDASPSFMVGSTRTGWRDLACRARVLSLDGEWIPIAPSVGEAGTTFVTGLVHEIFQPHWVRSERLREFVTRFRMRGTDEPEVARYAPLLRYANEVESDHSHARDASHDALMAFVKEERQRQRAKIRGALASVLAVLGEPLIIS